MSKSLFLWTFCFLLIAAACSPKPATPEQLAALPTIAVILTLTPSDTPTITNTPAPTNTPTITLTPTPITPTATSTEALTPTITNTVPPSPTLTDTVPPPTLTPIPPTDAPPETWYTVSTANLRECPRTDCAAITQVPGGTAVTVVGTVQGEAYKGSDIWRKLSLNGHEGYVHSSLVSVTRPAPTAIPVQQVQSQPPAPPISQPPQTGGSCPSLSATCGQLVSCDQARACLAAGNSSLDGDGDGTPCESLCGG